MVKRYDCDVCYDVGMTAHASGDWVSYSDYAALLKERDALAAENAALNKFIKDDCWIWDDKSEEYFDAADCMPETPATDAFLAEVRAQGVEMAMEHMQSSGSLTFGDCYISLNEFAAKLRKGGNQ